MRFLLQKMNLVQTVTTFNYKIISLEQKPPVETEFRTKCIIQCTFFQDIQSGNLTFTMFMNNQRHGIIVKNKTHGTYALKTLLTCKLHQNTDFFLC